MNLIMYPEDIENVIQSFYQTCRKAPDFRHGDIRHTFIKQYIENQKNV